MRDCACRSRKRPCTLLGCRRITPNPWPDVRERGTQVVGANPTVLPWEAQALSALARQLTPQADERGRCLAGANPQCSSQQLDDPERGGAECPGDLAGRRRRGLEQAGERE